MKHLLLLAAAYLLLGTPSLRAQFQPSSTPDIRIPNSDSSEFTYSLFNYSVGHADIGGTDCDLYVCAWSDQPYAHQNAFYYKRTVADDPTGILDDGLVTLPNAGRIYGAIILNKPFSTTEFCVAVVYQNNSGGGGISFLEWTPTGLVLMPQYTQTFAPSANINNMKIVAIGLSYYTVVFTDFSNNNMYAFGGDIQGNYYPLVSPAKQIMGNSAPGTGFLPDVAMTMLNNPPAGMLPTGIKLYFSYISPDKENCLVSYLGFSQLMTGAPPLGLNLEWTVAQITFLANSNSTNMNPCYTPGIPSPRYFQSRGPSIDAPDFSDDSWAVIVEQGEHYDGLTGSSSCQWPENTNNLLQLLVSVAYKFNGGSIQDKVLNNNTSFPTIPTSADMSKNFSYPFSNDLFYSQPAVAFSAINPTINFAWGTTQFNTNLPGGIFWNYLGMDFDPGSNMYLGLPYRIVDQNPALQTINRAIAFSGNSLNPPKNLYTVFGGNINNPSLQAIYQKHPLWQDIDQIGYKPTNITIYDQNKLKATALPNPFDNSFSLAIDTDYKHEILDMSMRDVLGRKVFSANGNIRAVNQSLHQFLIGNTSLNTGMYFLQLKAINSGEISTLKIIKR